MPEVTTNPSKVKPKLNPPKGDAPSKHPNAPIRLQSGAKKRGNKTVKDRSR